MHIQCLLRVDGSIVAAWCLLNMHPSLVLCLNLHIPTQQVACSLLVAWYSNCFSAAVASCRNWWLFSSIGPYAVVSNQFRSQLLTVKLLL